MIAFSSRRDDLTERQDMIHEHQQAHLQAELARDATGLDAPPPAGSVCVDGKGRVQVTVFAPTISPHAKRRPSAQAAPWAGRIDHADPKRQTTCFDPLHPEPGRRGVRPG